MIAETALAAWIIACVYVPFLLAVTRVPSIEVRRVTNALVAAQAQRIAAGMPVAMAYVTTHGVSVNRSRVDALAETLTAVAPTFAVEVPA